MLCSITFLFQLCILNTFFKIADINFGGFITTTFKKITRFQYFNSTVPARISAAARSITINRLGINTCKSIPAPKHTNASPTVLSTHSFIAGPPFVLYYAPLIFCVNQQSALNSAFAFSTSATACTVSPFEKSVSARFK